MPAPLGLFELRQHWTELINFLSGELHRHSTGIDFKLAASRMLLDALDRYLQLLRITEVQAEVRQLERVIARGRQDDEDGDQP